MKPLFFLPFLCLITFFPAMAQDINAYDVPKDISYVRVMNFSNDTLEQHKLNGQDIDPVGTQKISKYYPVPGYSAKLHQTETVIEKSIRPGRFYSFIRMNDSGTVLFHEEKKLLNPTKAFIHFYNLTDRPTLELKSNNGKSLVALADKDGLDSRDINAAPVLLGVYANRSAVAEVPELKLEEGKATTIIVIGRGKGLKVIVQ